MKDYRKAAIEEKFGERINALRFMAERAETEEFRSTLDAAIDAAIDEKHEHLAAVTLSDKMMQFCEDNKAAYAAAEEIPFDGSLPANATDNGGPDGCGNPFTM